MIVAPPGVSNKNLRCDIEDTKVHVDNMPEDNKIESYVHMRRFTDMLSALGPRLRANADHNIDRIGLIYGLRYEASLAAVLSGTLAVRGQAMHPIPDNLPPEQSIQAAVQRFAYSDPNNGLQVLAATWASGDFSVAHINAVYKPIPHSTWEDEATELLKKALKEEWRGPDSCWWRSERRVDSQTSAAMKSGMAAFLYLNAEPFVSQRAASCRPSTAASGLEGSNMVIILESVLGQVHRLRQGLVQQQRSLINACVDQELHFAATYSALYDGVPESASDHLDGLMGDLGIAGDRNHVRSLVNRWTA